MERARGAWFKYIKNKDPKDFRKISILVQVAREQRAKEAGVFSVIIVKLHSETNSKAADKNREGRAARSGCGYQREKLEPSQEFLIKRNWDTLQSSS